MSTDRWIQISRQLSDLKSLLVTAVLVWLYYRRRTFPAAYRYSTFWPRFWTGTIDACVLWPITLIASSLLTLNIPRSLAASLVAIPSLAWFLYTVVMHARYGQTVGKMVTKVRIVDFHTEGKISFRQALLREGLPILLGLALLGYKVSAILSGRLTLGDLASGKELAVSRSFWLLAVLPGLWFAAEVLTMLTNPKRRALHDYIAGTVVVRTNIPDYSQHDGSVEEPASGDLAGRIPLDDAAAANAGSLSQRCIESPQAIET
jgi:uncharacterized RDD family membrane protein YckC